MLSVPTLTKKQERERAVSEQTRSLTSTGREDIGIPYAAKSRAARTGGQAPTWPPDISTNNSRC